jgi:hypothetical protein
MNRLDNREIKIEKTALTKAHRDFPLKIVQRNVSSRVFEHFYANYIDSYGITLANNIKNLKIDLTNYNTK